MGGLYLHSAHLWTRNRQEVSDHLWTYSAQHPRPQPVSQLCQMDPSGGTGDRLRNKHGFVEDTQIGSRRFQIFLVRRFLSFEWFDTFCAVLVFDIPTFWDFFSKFLMGSSLLVIEEDRQLSNTDSTNIRMHFVCRYLACICDLNQCFSLGGMPLTK